MPNWGFWGNLGFTLLSFGLLTRRPSFLSRDRNSTKCSHRMLLGRRQALVWVGVWAGMRSGKGSQRRSGRRLEEVAKAVGGGYCRLQMPRLQCIPGSWFPDLISH